MNVYVYGVTVSPVTELNMTLLHICVLNKPQTLDTLARMLTLTRHERGLHLLLQFVGDLLHAAVALEHLHPDCKHHQPAPELRFSPTVRAFLREGFARHFVPAYQAGRYTNDM